jgi:hypothetical protein
MRHAVVAVFCLNVLGAIALLSLAVCPGMLESVAFEFPFVCLILPFLGAWFVLLIALMIWDLARWRAANHQRWGLWASLVMFATLGLLWFHVPQLAVFWIYESEFRSLADAHPDDGSRRWSIERRIGPYFVDRYGQDRSGGVYFRTFTGPDGIGPDQMEYGFAFRPSGDGAPFGRSRHRVRHLFGDWYTFEGSND